MNSRQQLHEVRCADSRREILPLGGDGAAADSRLGVGTSIEDERAGRNLQAAALD
jgi:hypothetical protein